jgi:L-2-hydroxyglutarate oxidase LhgO
MAQAKTNGIEARMLSREEVTAKEPNAGHRCNLFAQCGVVEPTRLVYKLFTLASNNGAHFLTNTEVRAIRMLPGIPNSRFATVTVGGQVLEQEGHEQRRTLRR